MPCAPTTSSTSPREVADEPAQTAQDGWHLYLLECQGGKLYAGIAKDVQARFKAHLSGKGAKFTRANPPLRVIATRPYPDRSLASKAEYELKLLPRRLKPQFFETESGMSDSVDHDHDFDEEATCPAPTP
ncbi:MAG: hypothetical protein E6Q67_00855 [Roseateles sp.]|nr:MAG: hypothetical protein E6Q67_00855 [Roseateles sp.]